MIISKLIILLLVFSATLQENIVLNLEQNSFQSILQKHLEESMSFTFLPKNFVFHDTMKGSLTSFSLFIPEKKDLQVRFVEPEGVEFSVKNPQFVFEMPCTSKTNTDKTLIQHVEFTVSEMKLYFEVKGRLPSLRTADFSEGKGTIDSVKFKTEPAHIDSLKQLPSAISDFNGIVFEAFRFRTGELTVKLNKFLNNFEHFTNVFPFKVAGESAHYMGNFFNGIPYDVDSDYAMKVTPRDPQGLYINVHTIKDYLNEKCKRMLNLDQIDARKALFGISKLITPEDFQKIFKNLDKITRKSIEIKLTELTELRASKGKHGEFSLTIKLFIEFPSENRIFDVAMYTISPTIRFDAKVEQNIIKINWIKAEISQNQPPSTNDIPKEEIEKTVAILNEILADLASNLERKLNNIDITLIFDLSQLFGLTNVSIDVERVDTGFRINIGK